MPIASLVTNVKVDDVKLFSISLSKACSEAWGLDDNDGSRTSSSVVYNESLNFNGNHDPAFLLEFRIVDMAKAGTEKRDAFAKALCAFFEKELSIAQSRGSILFRVLADDEIAMDGITYESWLHKQLK
ncbi:Tautomerase/MIF [Mycena sp. CBHHK59/15]|nr:Tautomerase/MIF [Mycena sp. CBHHK59/15]